MLVRGALVRIGVPGWAVEGLTDSAHLTYARLSGVEYGASVVATSTEEREAPSSNEFAASIYPNPFADRFTIETNDRVALPLRFEVIDALGRRVLAGTIDESQTTVDASALAAGFYFVRITDGAQVATRAVVRTAAR
ncbi:MAG TPA: T9SS type A sorting domain-containing protein [Rhodothermales bacterium]